MYKKNNGPISRCFCLLVLTGNSLCSTMLLFNWFSMKTWAAFFLFLFFCILRMSAAFLRCHVKLKEVQLLKMHLETLSFFHSLRLWFCSGILLHQNLPQTVGLHQTQFNFWHFIVLFLKLCFDGSIHHCSAYSLSCAKPFKILLRFLSHFFKRKNTFGENRSNIMNPVQRRVCICL